MSRSSAAVKSSPATARALLESRMRISEEQRAPLPPCKVRPGASRDSEVKVVFRDSPLKPAKSLRARLPTDGLASGMVALTRRPASPQRNQSLARARTLPPDRMGHSTVVIGLRLKVGRPFRDPMEP